VLPPLLQGLSGKNCTDPVLCCAVLCCAVPLQVILTYTIQDRWGLTATGTLTITVVAYQNKAPIAVGDNWGPDFCRFGPGAEVTAGTQVNMSVLTNDQDPEGDTLTIVEVSPVWEALGRPMEGARADISEDGRVVVLTTNAPLASLPPVRAAWRLVLVHAGLACT
jgi:Bacterial cadherin-like domain